MLEYFSYQKYKKHKAKSPKPSPSTTPATDSTTPTKMETKTVEETATPSPVLNQDDEDFLQRIVSEEGPAPPLPARPSLNTETTDEQSGPTAETEDADTEVKGKEPEEGEKAEKKGSSWTKRLSFIKMPSKLPDLPDLPELQKKLPDLPSLPSFSRNKDGLKATQDVPADEAEKEEDDIAAVLEQLNLAAVNNTAFSLSKESQEIVQKFTLVLKDLVNGVPTAYDDLTHLLDNSSEHLEKTFDKLPSSLKKLVASLPSKMTSSLAPELLAAAAEAQAISSADAAAAGGSLSAAAKKMFRPTNLKDLVTKPGAVSGLLRAIMNALRARWPAFLGTNVLWSLALFVLLFVFWYCHKRGREVRLSREQLVDEDGNLVDVEKLSIAESSTSATPEKAGKNSSNLPSGAVSPGEEVILDTTQPALLEPGTGESAREKLNLPEVKIDAPPLEKEKQTV